MKFHPTLISALTCLAATTLAPSADAQVLWRWFGPKSQEKAPPAKSTPLDLKRITEVNVEVAWLADPATFPYYLEAHANNDQLEVRGYVPSRSVRDQAMRIAQVHSSLPVVDSMKEHASLLVRPGQLSTTQLQSSVQSSLKVALPKTYSQLKVQVDPEGKVFVTGPVTNYEEKIAVSHSLRRLHGCTSVQNLTSLPAELTPAPVVATMEPREKAPIVKTSNTSNPETRPNDKTLAAAEPKTRPWYWPFGKNTTTKDEPPLLDTPKSKPKEKKDPAPAVEPKKASFVAPVVINTTPEIKEPEKLPKKTETPRTETPPVKTPAKGPTLTAAEFQKRIKQACPEAKGVEVEFTSATEIRIVLEIRSEKELEPAAERVFAMPELERYRADLQFKISAP